jgi:predicted dehydrogenase
MTIRFLWVLTVIAVVFSPVVEIAAADEDVLKVGIVGCDTSHVTEFTRVMNERKESGRDVKVVMAYPGGSDIPESRDRLAGFVERLKSQGVEIVDSAEVVAEKCDAILLESVDGRTHLEQFRTVARGKPVFVDKPLAANLAGAIEIFRIAEETGTPCFTSSAARYIEQVRELQSQTNCGELVGAETSGPMKMESHHPDLYWYGIHGVEALYTLLGPGCESVARIDTPSSSLVAGTWKSGRIGSYRGIKNDASFAFTIYGTRRAEFRQGFSGYDRLVEEISRFFVTRKSPVEASISLEIYAWMEAADESLRQGGAPISISETMQKAEAALTARKP